MYTQAGTCPKCGAPIYVPTVWHGVLPPPPVYTCQCTPQPLSWATADSTTAAH